MSDAPQPTAPVEWDEVQRILLRGYRRHPYAHFSLLRVTRRADAARWLGRLLDERVVEFGWDPSGALPAGSIALSSEGLDAFGLSPATIAGFAPEFVEGMTNTARSRILADVGSSAPERWLWGYDDNRVHLVLSLYATSESALAEAVARHRAELDASGLVEVVGADGSPLGACAVLEKRREHFGFADGISQPRFAAEPAGVVHRPPRDADRIATGELLLGYANEAGIFPRSPTLSATDRSKGPFARPDGDFGKNGSYLVFRQLAQDVRAFWQATRMAKSGATVDDRIEFASKMVGRRPDGTPLVDRGRSTPGDPETFDFAHDDPYGRACPLSAHIRRANPRATLSNDPIEGLAKSKKHRILRRGRSYGAPLADPLSPEALIRAADSELPVPGARGLHFLGFNADIANQFEFVQQTWVNGAVFQGLHGEVDALLGDPSATGGLFSIPADPLRCRFHGLPRFVDVRGGAYFFAPSRAALRFLSLLA